MSTRITGIYKITSPTNRIYIGKSNNINRRFKDYRKPVKKGRKSLIHDSIKKYGYDSHIFEILEQCELDKLNEREMFYIEYFRTNVTKYREGNGLNLYDGGNSPVIQSSDRLREIALSRKSRDEWSEYFKNVNTGRKHINRRPRTITEKVLNHYNRLHKNNQKRIEQFDISGTYIKTFDSLVEAAKSVNGKYQSLYRVCEGKRKTAYGFKWKWPIE